MSQVLQGKGVGLGWAVGPAIRQQATRRVVKQYRIGADQVEHEQQKLADAIQGVDERLQKLKRKLRILPNRDPYLIVEAHQQMLVDRSFATESSERIRRQRVNASWAVQQAVEEIEKVFNAIDDPYIRTRLDDINNLRDLVIDALADDTTTVENELQGAIVVAHDLTPHLMLEVIRAGAKGVVMEAGNASGHAAIIAKSMGVPLIIHVKGLLDQVASGTSIAINGEDHTVHINPSSDVLKTLQTASSRLDQAWLDAHAPSVMKDGSIVSIEANLDVPEELVAEHVGCIDGVGLVRTEVAFMADQLPTEEDLVEQYKRYYRTVDGKPVVFRALDFGGDKDPMFIDPDARDDSPLGQRGIRFLFEHPDVMRMQLRALLRASDGGSLDLMLPMIIDTREIRRYRAEIEALINVLKVKVKLRLGAMIETPAATMIVKQLAKEVDFFSVGTNDLIQYMLCVDRANEHVADLYEPMHPAVLRTLRRIYREAGDVPITICGEMASDPVVLPILIGFGYRKFSMPVPNVPQVKTLIRSLKAKDCKALAKTTEQAMTSAEIRALAEVFSKRWAV